MKKLGFSIFGITSVLICLLIGFLVGSIFGDLNSLSTKIKSASFRLTNTPEVAKLELFEQMMVSRYTFWQLWVSFGALIISTFALIGLWRSLRQTQTSLDDARSLGEAEATCYVHAAAARWGKGNKIILHCKNSGMTPAVHFGVSCRGYIATRGHISSTLNFEPSDLKTWSSLSGGTTLTVSLDQIDFKEVASFIKIAPDPLEVFVVCGSIYYSNVFGKTFKTQFAFYTSNSELKAKFARPISQLEVHQQVKHFPTEKG